jgi:phosphatidylserine decarboxylase
MAMMLPGTQGRTRLFVLLQLCLPTRWLSWLIHHLSRVQWRPFKNGLIRAFIRGFKISLVEAEIERAEDFPHFNAFFTRALKPGARQLAAAPALLSPVDGTLSQHGCLDDGLLIQAKGHRYTTEALLTHAPWADAVRGGEFATIYLAPYNYHRIHMPADATLRAWRYVPGRLFSVNAATAGALPNLFARNERLVTVFDTAGGVLVMVLVGALFVGGIETVWTGPVTPPHLRGAPSDILHQGSDCTLARGAEMGRFNMGSTVILLTAPGMVTGGLGDAPGQVLQQGATLAMLKIPPGRRAG